MASKQFVVSRRGFLKLGAAAAAAAAAGGVLKVRPASAKGGLVLSDGETISRLDPRGGVADVGGVVGRDVAIAVVVGKNQQETRPLGCGREAGQ